MEKYRKKPVVIEAMEYTGGNGHKIAGFMGRTHSAPIDQKIIIETLEGDMTVSPGDYIIKGIKGEYYPCKPDIFKATYDKVQEQPQ